MCYAAPSMVGRMAALLRLVSVVAVLDVGELDTISLPLSSRLRVSILRARARARRAPACSRARARAGHARARQSISRRSCHMPAICARNRINRLDHAPTPRRAFNQRGVRTV